MSTAKSCLRSLPGHWSGVGILMFFYDVMCPRIRAINNETNWVFAA